MTVQLPFASRELRWFFEGPLSDQPALEDWFFGCAPFATAGDVGAPVWQPRRDDAPDVYLLLPDQGDMGIKWREGLLQVKGLVADLGRREYCGRHAGNVERWIKWSYADLPDGYADLFGSPAVTTVAVHKSRAVRLVDLGAGARVEVSPETVLDCGIAVELTRIVVDGHAHCSLGFEAFPDDRLTDAVFDAAVTGFLGSLDALRLDADRSMSYAAWLNCLQRSGLGV
jgi:hypothetical protein